jgi:ATP-dependent Clp protease ATP-binding subunit ClpA
MSEFTFSDPVRQALITARALAGRRNQQVVGPEHIYLALLMVPGPVVTQALRTIGVEVGSLVTALNRHMWPESPQASTPTTLPYRDLAKDLLEAAMIEAGELGHATIEREHLLLGIARHADGRVQRDLTGIPLTLPALRRAVRVARHEPPMAVPGGTERLLRTIECTVSWDDGSTDTMRFATAADARAYLELL